MSVADGRLVDEPTPRAGPVEVLLHRTAAVDFDLSHLLLADAVRQIRT
jgi:hypothetical protein